MDWLIIFLGVAFLSGVILYSSITGAEVDLEEEDNDYPDSDYYEPKEH